LNILKAVLKHEVFSALGCTEPVICPPFADAQLRQEYAQLLPLFTSNAEMIWKRLLLPSIV